MSDDPLTEPGPEHDVPPPDAPVNLRKFSGRKTLPVPGRRPYDLKKAITQAGKTLTPGTDQADLTEAQAARLRASGHI